MAEWTVVCTQLDSQIFISALYVYDGRLYGGTGSGGRLFRLNEAGTAWEQVCAQLDGEIHIRSLCVYNGELYGGTFGGGRLFRLNEAGTAWEQVCAKLDSQIDILALYVYNGELYGGTYSGGRLFRLNEAGTAWEQVCAQLNSQIYIVALYVYNGRLYGGTGSGGRLFRLNEAGTAWEQVCAQLNSQSYISALCVYDGRLYGGTGSGGRLFRLNEAGTAWEQVCAQLDGQTAIVALYVYNGRLYGGTGSGGRLFRLNEAGTAWEQVCAQLDSQSYIYSLCVYNGELYGGTYDGGRLFRADDLPTTTTTPAPTTTTTAEPVTWDLRITEDDYFTKDQPSKSEELRNKISVTTQPLELGAYGKICDSQEVAIPAGSTKTVEIKYSKPPAKTAVASLIESAGGTLSILSATYYAWGATVVVQNTGGSAGTCKVQINGTLLAVTGEEIVTAEDADSILEFGTLKYEYPINHLIQTRAMAETISAGLLASYKTPRKDISITWRGNPALELGDVMRLPEYHKNGLNIKGDFAVYKNKLEYDGTLRAATEGRKV